MKTTPAVIADFLSSKRIAVAGVSRDKHQTANAIFRRFRELGYDVIPVNPKATELEGTRAYPDLASIPGTVDALLVATHPDAGVDLVRQCGQRGVKKVWFHRGIGSGSYSEAAVREAKALGLSCIEGGCPFMYCKPVDIFHRGLHTCLRWMHRIP